MTTLIYDSHLSTHYMVIKVPDWSWLQSRWVGAFSIRDYQILNLLAYVFGISLLVMINNIRLPMIRTKTAYKVNPSLTKYQIALGTTFLLFAVISLFAFIEKLTAFCAALEFDPGVMYLSNLSGFGFRLLNFLLLILYGQWILRDGLTLRRNIFKTPGS